MTMISFTPPTQYGWVCPKCGRVHGPMMMSCPCYMNQVGTQKYKRPLDITPKVEWNTPTRGPQP